MEAETVSLEHNIQTWYTVYEAHLDTLVVIGTAEECAAYIGISTRSFKKMVSDVKRGKIKSLCIVVEDLESGAYKAYGTENGVDTPLRRRELDERKARYLYYAGLKDSEIAEELQVTEKRVTKWRRKNRLPAMTKSGTPRKMAS